MEEKKTVKIISFFPFAVLACEKERRKERRERSEEEKTGEKNLVLCFVETFTKTLQFYDAWFVEGVFCVQGHRNFRTFET